MGGSGHQLAGVRPLLLAVRADRPGGALQRPWTARPSVRGREEGPSRAGKPTRGAPSSRHCDDGNNETTLTRGRSQVTLCASKLPQGMKLPQQ